MNECPRCGSQIQLTRKSYWKIVDDELVLAYPGQPDVWDMYCENDHQIAESIEASPSQVTSLLDEWAEQDWSTR